MIGEPFEENSFEGRPIRGSVYEAVSVDRDPMSDQGYGQAVM